MRVLLVHSLEDAQSVMHPLASLEDIQMGLSYISAVLREAGHETRLVVLSPAKAKAANRIVDESIVDFRPGIIGFTTVFSQFPFLSRMAQFIRLHHPDLFLVVGGPHPTLNPGAVLDGGFDAVCVGEGEHPMLELADQLGRGETPTGIPNLWFRKRDGSVEQNPSRDFVQDLDALPFPDRDMWMPWLREKAGARLSVLLGRGCPFNCTYCCNHALARQSPGKYVRMRSPARILDEIRVLHERFPGKPYIYLEVETITTNKEWLLDLCAQLVAYNTQLSSPIAYGCNFRITTRSLDEDIFAALEAANFISLNIGLESGSERVRREVLNRRYSNEEVAQAAALAHKHGLSINLYDLIGVPGETLEDHAETVRMTRLVNPGRVIKSIFFPYPGTRLEEVCVEQGVLSSALDVSMERRRAVLDLPGFSRRQIQHAYTWFEYNVYKGMRPMPELLIRTLRNKLKASPMAEKVYLKLVQLPWLDRIRARGEGSINALGTPGQGSSQGVAREGTSS